MTTFASSEPGRHDPVPGSWIEDRESPERGHGERKPDNGARWGGWIKKAGTVGMIVWALSGVGRDNAPPAHETGPRTNRATAAAAVELEPTSPAKREAAHERLAEARRAELDTVLDSMLITHRIEPGTPFEQRSGHIADEGVRRIAQKIDDRLGGRIEWPSIQLVDGLVENKQASGEYRLYTTDGNTAPEGVNDERRPDKRYGISLDRDLVENELRTGEPRGISIESLLVHELQHATSQDHNDALRASADKTERALVSMPYEDIREAARTMKPEYDASYSTSESRAGLAMILNREIELRERLGGPKLNEMPEDERRAAVGGILMQYVENHSNREMNEAELLGALKDPKYIFNSGSENELPNPIWEPDINATHTVSWAMGHDIAGHRPRDTGLFEHLKTKLTDLPGMADRWTSGESHRPPERTDALMTPEELAEYLEITTSMREREKSRAQAPQDGTPATASRLNPQSLEGPHEQPPPRAEAEPGNSRGATAYQGYTIERRDKPDPRETGLLAENDYQEDIGRELDAILDSMLVTSRVPPGTPFEERVGAIPNDHIRALMKDIDKNLGGRIEWPNIQISEELSVPHALAQYRAYIGANGATVPENVNLEAPADEKFGISIRRDMYESGIGEAAPIGVSLRSALVHELQHATSSDNVRTLERMAEENGWPYTKDRHGMAEGRADLAVLLEREIDARKGAGGPQLNDMAPDERREAISQILGGYLGAEPDEPEHVRDAKLLLALRDPAYVASPDNLMWQRNGDDRTVDYIYGRDQSGNFVPSHNTPEERERDLQKPLNELAAEWRNSTGTDTENRAEAPNRQDRQTPQTGSRTADLQAPERNTSEKAPSAYLTTSASQPAAPAERPAAPAEQPAAPAEQPAAPADTEPEPERKTEARHGQTHQAGRAHLKLLRHAQHHRANEPAKTPEDRAGRSSASAGEDEFAAPSGRYSSGRTRRGETTPVRGGERSVGGSPPAAQQQPTAQRASTR